MKEITIKEQINNLLSDINGYSLDKEQRKVVLCNKKSILVIAGAGSGKSLTIIGKIRYLIEIEKINSNEILCITFTKEASNNLEKNINSSYNYGIKVYTFHKLALELLKEKNYKICQSDLLEYIVNEYFYIIESNKEFIKKVKIILNKVDTSYKKILNSKELFNLKKLIITFINLLKTNNYNIYLFLKIKKDKELIRIIIDIYLLYEMELRSTNSIDFNDMIILASEYVKTNNINKYKYIIVDEYQDTSYIRYLLLKELVNKTDSKIICVGDDYQSIYRFTGCNINMFLDFKKLFKHAKVLKISNTYRNSQELIDIAGHFIMKNKNQLYKRLKSKKRNNKPIKIMYSNSLIKLINYIINYHSNIMILGRNNFDIKKYYNFTEYKGKNINYMTVHSSKGLEAECVVLINLIDDLLGFPNQIKDNSILKYVNNNKSLYPYEEERRLFYVALTRSKSDVYILANKNNMSIFLKEIIRDNKKYIEYI